MASEIAYPAGVKSRGGLEGFPLPVNHSAVTATLAHARDVLADRRLFMLEGSAWSEFVSVVDRPVSHKPRLEKLFADPSIFDEG